jgi:MoxR-like ATPase
MSTDPEIPKWWIYCGTAQPIDGELRLPEPPPWRSFTGVLPEDGSDEMPEEPGDAHDPGSPRRLGHLRQAVAYRPDDEEINLLNLALHLRRPLLVTGRPGVGKSTLAYSVAHELRLGPVLRWAITSRSTLTDGLYQYDAIGRLQEVSLQREGARTVPDESRAPTEIGAYVTLGPLGTALLPRRKPRVLLIDEIDKSDIDLPNDLLNIFEEGEYIIPELARLKEQKITVKTADPGGAVTLHQGLVRCADFPVVILTSNNERDFPPAFLRRCVRLEIPPPSEAKLARMVDAHLAPAATSEEAAKRRQLIAEFLRKQREEAAILANDQLLNALAMAAAGLWDTDQGQQLIGTHLLRPLDQV